MDEGADRERDLVYRKVAWRVMPFLLLCYVANYIDATIDDGNASTRVLSARTLPL